MGPAAPGEQQSQLNVLTISPGEFTAHCNRYLRLPIKEVSGMIIDSSVERMKTFDKFQPPKNKEDVIEMLGDQSSVDHTVWRENGGEEYVKTVACGIFDCVERTWSLYSDNPKTNPPLVVLPLVLKKND